MEEASSGRKAVGIWGDFAERAVLDDIYYILTVLKRCWSDLECLAYEKMDIWVYSACQGRGATQKIKAHSYNNKCTQLMATCYTGLHSTNIEVLDIRDDKGHAESQTEDITTLTGTLVTDKCRFKNAVRLCKTIRKM